MWGREEGLWLIKSRSRYRDNSFSPRWHPDHHNLRAVQCPVSEMRPCLAPGLCPMLPALPNFWRVESEVRVRHKVRIMHEGMEASAVIQLSATSLISHGLWELCQTLLMFLCPWIYWYSHLCPKWKGMLTIKHQTLTGPEHWTKGIMAKLMMEIILVRFFTH